MPARRRPYAFFALTLALAVPFWIAGGVSGVMLLPGLPLAGLMAVCPGLAALILVWRDEGRPGARAFLARMLDGRRIRRLAWLAPVLLLAPAQQALAFFVQRATGAPVPAPQIALTPALALAAFFMVGAWAEELGWSGYAIDPLQDRHGPLKGALVVGVVWALFHFVALVQAQRDLAWIAWWSLGTLAARVVMVWLYDNTGRSVLAVSLFHMSQNLAWQLYPVQGSYFDPKVSGLIAAALATLVIALWRPPAPTGRGHAPITGT